MAEFSPGFPSVGYAGTAVLSIGSNIGDRLSYLRLAVSSLAGRLVAISGIYQTAAWGKTDQADFLNAVLIAREPSWSPADWLAAAQAAETAAHRERSIRWGPRTLDVDVISVRDSSGAAIRSADPALTLPHPRAAERAFVLVPWAEVEPSAELPGVGAVSAAADRLMAADPDAVRRRSDLTLSSDTSVVGG